MSTSDMQPADPARPRNALELRQQSYMLQTGLAKPEASDKADTAISLREIFALIVKHKWLLIAALAVTMLASMVSYMTSVPVYQSTAVMQIDRVARIVQFNKDVDPFQEDDYLMLQTQYELLKSRSLAERVADELNLDTNRARKRETGLPTAPAATVVPPVEVATSGAAVAPAQAGASAAEPDAGIRRFGKSAGGEKDSSARNAVVGSLMGAVSIDPVKSSRLVKIRVSHTNPAEASRIANSYARSFIMLNMERRSQSSEYARTFLDEQIRVTKAKLEESERAVNAYAKSNSILTLDEKTNVISQTYTEYSTALARVEQERLKAEAVYNAVAANPENSQQLLDSKSVQNYKEQRAKLEAEYTNGLSLYKPDFPKMVQLKAQISEIDARIKTEASAVLTAVKSQLDAARRQEDQVRAKLSDTRKEVITNQDKSVDFNLLKRELDTNRQIYDSLLQRLKEVSVTSGVMTNNISVVDEAKTPGFPISPNLSKNLGMGLIAGLLLGALLIFVKEQLDDSIKHANEVEEKLGVPVLGVIPRVRKKELAEVRFPALLTMQDQRGAFAEAYRSTRTALQFSTPEGAPRRLMVTSSVQSEGKSTSSLSLAINFAQMGRRVLLIDADMRNPSLYQALGVSNEGGLSTYLAGAKREDELIQETGIVNLSFMAAGPHPPSPVDLLMGPRLLELLDRADALGFDNIIIDAPPVLGLADAIVLGNQIQNILFAIKANDTRLSRINDAMRRLRIGGLLPLGALLTGVQSEESKYAGYYGYGVYGAKNAAKGSDGQITHEPS
jgi:polysaccharide biosynthesis transport protein